MRRRSAVAAVFSSLSLLLLSSASHADGTLPAPALVRLSGNIPRAVADAQPMGTCLDPQIKIDLALTLPVRNKAELDDLTRRLFDPADPLYKHYLTPEEVSARFGPTQADYDAVVAFAKSKGLTVTQTWRNRTLVDVSGPANVVEAAFGTHLMQYKDSNGRVFHAPATELSVPANIASRLQGVIGLDDAAQWGGRSGWKCHPACGADG